MNFLGKTKKKIDKVYGLVWGECTEEIQTEVKYLDDYDAKYGESNIIWILGVLQAATYGIE